MDGSDGLPLTICLAAATGLGVLAYRGSNTWMFLFFRSNTFVFLHTMYDPSCRLRYCYSFWVQPLLFSLTLLHIDEFFNKKVAPKDLFGEIKVASHLVDCFFLNYLRKINFF
jgi:hypothetical protein